MAETPQRADFETDEEWITAIAAQSEADPTALVDEIVSQLGAETEGLEDDDG